MSGCGFSTARATAAILAAACLGLHPAVVLAAPSGRATYFLISVRHDMKLDPVNLVWSGRSKEVRRFRVDGTKGLDLGTFRVAKSSIVGIRSVRVRLRHAGEGWNDAELDVNESSLWPGYDAFNDQIVRTYTIRGLRIGDEVEIESELQHDLSWEIPGYTFGGRDSIRLEVYEVRMPESIVPAVEVRPGLLGWPAPRATTSRDGGRLVLRWEARDQPGLGDLEPDAPAFEQLLPTVRVAASRFARTRGDTVGVRDSWRSFAAWYEARVQPMLQLDPGLLAWVAGAKSTAQSRDDLVARIFAYVQQRVRYLAVHVGEGGWVPHAAPATFRAGYGDCKDMSTLLVALLREAGIPAYLALVNTRGRGEVSTTYPYCLQFDHCVAQVPDPRGDWWLDATGGFLRAGEVTPFITRSQALVLAADSTRFQRPVPRPAVDDERVSRFRLGPSQDGRAAVRFEFSAQGTLAPEWRRELEGADAKARLDAVAGWLRSYFDNVAETALDSLRLDSRRPTVIGRCTAASPVRSTSGPWVVARGVARLPMARGLDSRRLPLEIGPPRRLVAEFEVPAPAGALPDSSETVLEESFASFRLRTTARGGKWTCRRQLEWKVEMVPVADLPRFADFTRKAQRANDEILSVAGR